MTVLPAVVPAALDCTASQRATTCTKNKACRAWPVILTTPSNFTPEQAAGNCAKDGTSGTGFAALALVISLLLRVVATIRVILVITRIVVSLIAAPLVAIFILGTTLLLLLVALIVALLAVILITRVLIISIALTLILLVIDLATIVILGRGRSRSDCRESYA